MRTVYLIFKTDKWHSYSSMEIVFVGDDIDLGIDQLLNHEKCTDEQAEQLRNFGQSQCNDDVDYEFDIEEYKLNTLL